MDAKPQRLIRSMRVKNDENMPPQNSLAKTIHHRNKSTPALSTINSQAGLKLVAKRHAFGDVSNVVGTARTSKDDSNIPTKANAQQSLKPLSTIHERKSAALLRPAQRPLSVAGLRSLITGNNQIILAESSAKQNCADVQPLAQPNHARKTLSKRNTTIFKDVSLDTVPEIEPQTMMEVEPIKPEYVKATILPESIVLPETEIPLPPPPTEIIVEPSKEDRDHLSVIDHFPSDTSLPGIDKVSLDVPTQQSQFDFPPLPILQDVSPIQEEVQEFLDRGLAVIPASSTQSSVPVSSIAEKQLPLPPVPLQEQTLAPLAHANYLPSAPTEPEEYWDEEEDAYDEEGYVTARSFRSKGDNTTGSATTVLFPQMNPRARREIAAAKHLVESTRTIEEVEDESYDTSMVAEYGDEIFDYMRTLEVKMLPNPHYMDNQHEIQWSMRSVLMDWLVQVHHRFNLLPETLFLCSNYIDRFLSCKVVSLGKLQLVGATAIFIAAKYEEINCPSVQEIVYMVDGGYTVDEILKAERFMLTMLQFELGWPGPMSFLRRISKADDYDLETRTLAKYFLEVTLMDERFIGSPPSFLAAASHCLARLMLRKGTWSPHHVYYSGYTFSQLRPLLKLLLECCDNPRKHHSAVYNKYCDKRFKRASAFVETEIQRGFRLIEQTPCGESAPLPVVQFYDSMPYLQT